ncbi:hypothetical protein [Streptomyces sp. NPDC056730]|uniref:hypothetical protein n=1 Tax=unclassified Streptomyces TaxID=2593676 RepID=UPI003679AE64
MPPTGTELVACLKELVAYAGHRKKPAVKAGMNAGKSPSVASLYRALAEAEAAAADDGLPLLPKPVRRRAGFHRGQSVSRRRRGDAAWSLRPAAG